MATCSTRPVRKGASRVEKAMLHNDQVDFTPISDCGSIADENELVVSHRAGAVDES